MSDETQQPPGHDHWLVRPRTIRLLWVIFIAILVMTLLPDFVIHQHEDFGIEGSFGFFAWFGFLACVLMVVFAKLLGYVVKREDTYYDS